MSEGKRQFFGTDGIRSKANVYPLVPEFIVRLGEAAAEVFLEAKQSSGEWPVAVIGKDTRQSGDMIEAAIAAGFNSAGVDVEFCGVVPTPAIAVLTRERRAVCGVVISASHNPFGDNGIKFFGPDGYKLDDATEMEIERRALDESDPGTASVIGRCSRLEDAAERYIHFVKASVGLGPDSLSGLKVAIDAANGASFETSEAILSSLGADVSAFHNRPSGLNINEGCGCTHPEVIEQIVKDTGVQVGVSHDGDADRVLLCDETGSVLDGDEIMAIAAIAMIREGSLNDNTLVATVMSNAGLKEAVENAGGQVVRSGVGDRYVMEEMRKGGFNFGGEQSGHFIFLDYNTTGDGIVSALRLLQIVKDTGKPLSELRKVMTKFPQAQRNVRVSRKPELHSLKAYEMISQVEKELGDSGRVLPRYSGTEPLLRILIEGRDSEYIEEQADLIADAIASEIGA